MRKHTGGVNMLNKIPYNTLKLKPRDYEILLLRDLYDKTYTDIAKEFEISPRRVTQVYYRMKRKQIRLYINHLSIVNGHENVRQFMELYRTVYECYRDDTYAVAYLEKKYKASLAEYRAGEPGMPQQFIKSMPPFKPDFGEKLIKRVIEMREVEKKSYVEIGKELRITRSKAHDEYEMFYHKKVMAYIDTLQAQTNSLSEKDFFLDHYFRSNVTSKNRYELILWEHPELLGTENASDQIGVLQRKM